MNTKTKAIAPVKITYDGHTRFVYKVRYRELYSKGAIGRSKSKEPIINVNIGIRNITFPHTIHKHATQRQEINKKLTGLESFWANELTVIDAFRTQAFGDLCKHFGFRSLDDVRAKMEEEAISAEPDQSTNLGATIPFHYQSNNTANFSLQNLEESISRQWISNPDDENEFDDDCPMPQLLQRLDLGRSRRLLIQEVIQEKIQKIQEKISRQIAATERADSSDEDEIIFTGLGEASL